MRNTSLALILSLALTACGGDENIIEAGGGFASSREIITISESDISSYNFTATDDEIYRVTGNENYVYIDGEPYEIDIRGNRNFVVSAGNTTKITITGDGNEIHADDPNTKISDRGSNNSSFYY